MNYVQIEQFLTIVKYMNLSKAAQELYISQPALSLALGRLEKELSVRLFYRDGNKLILTPDGKELYGSFKDLYDAHQKLLSKAEMLHSHTEDQIRLCFSGSVLQFTALFSSDFLTSYDGKTIQKMYTAPDMAQELLLHKQAELAITYPPLHHEDISTINIMSEEIAVVVPNNHPLAGRGSVTLDELRPFSFIGLDKSNRFRNVVDEVCAQYNFAPHYIKECEYSSFYKAMEEGKDSTDIASFQTPRGYEAMDPDYFDIVHVSDVVLERTTGLSWLTERQLNYEYRGLIEHITNDYGDFIDKHHDVVSLFAHNI